MKRLLVRFGVAVGLLAAPLAMVTGGPAGAQTLVKDVVDLHTSISIPTPVVSPPGTLAMYKVSVSEGPVVVPGTVTVGLPAGSVVDTAHTGGCRATGASVSCDFSAAATFTIVATTPTSASTYTVTSDVVATGPLAALEYDAPGDNHAEATIDVKPLPEGVASGVVTRGHSISLDLGGGRTYTLTVPTTSINTNEKGVIVTIKGAPIGRHTCPGGTCGADGFNVTFDNTTDLDYKWTDSTHPLVSISGYGTLASCRGIGNGCWELGYTDLTAEDAPIFQQPWCIGATDTSRGTTDQALPGSLCTNDKYKVNGVLTWETLLTSTDPIQLPIGKLGA